MPCSGLSGTRSPTTLSSSTSESCHSKSYRRLLTHSSGHGGQTKDVDGDEDDGNDEVIYPVDFKQAGHIVDDQSEESRRFL